MAYPKNIKPIMRNLIKVILILGILFSCSDNVRMIENDLNKYPWLKRFLIHDLIDFKGNLNIDTSSSIFSYSVSSIDENTFFNTMDSLAKNDGWHIIYYNKFSRKYEKNINLYKYDSLPTLLNIELDTIKSRLFFRIN
jgi:hypothetical protein